jgi:hypothetical protein
VRYTLEATGEGHFPADLAISNSNQMHSRRPSQLRLIIVGVFLWLFVCGALLWIVWPRRPATPLQWALFVLIGPLLYGAMEYLGERALSEKISSRISTRRFSWLRIAYAFIVFVAGLAVALGVLSLLASSPSPSMPG